MSSAKEAKLEEILEELIRAAESCGLEVRREKLLREIGYRARSGSCRVREKNLVILDREQPVSEQLEVLVDALRERDLESVYLSPAAREVVERPAG